MNAAFAAALLDPALPVPAGLRTWNGSDPAARLAVYRNNVVGSLIDALADNCPVVRALVGDEFFRAMAAVFVRRSPPRSPVLAHYGTGLAEFIAEFEPARSVAYLADVARLETLRMCALHAADAGPLTPEAARAAFSDPDRAAACRLRWHPSAALLRSRFAVVSIWAAHQCDGEPDLGGLDWARPEDALVLRDGMQVLVLPLAAGGAAFVDAAWAGGTFGAAAALASQAEPQFDLAATLTLLLRHGAVTAIDNPRSPVR